MNKRQVERYVRIRNELMEHGLDDCEINSLLRASKTLSTWAEHECNGEIQRDGDDGDGRPAWYNTNTGKKICYTSDREAGALKRAAKIAKSHGLEIYHQGDPRGCALYIIRPGDVKEGQNVGSCYNNGLAICID